MTAEEIVACAKPFSMTAGNNLMATIGAVQLIDQGIQGDIVECGVWRGGHIIAAMLAGQTPRNYWLFDTFDGMAEPGPNDTRRGVHATQTTKYTKHGVKHWCRAELAEVQNNISRYARPGQTAIYVVGPVEQTLIKHTLPEKIALLRLDTDFYSSTLIELQTLWSRLQPGGVLIVDDYGSWDGCKKACKEFFGSDFSYQAINDKAIKVIKS